MSENKYTAVISGEGTTIKYLKLGYCDSLKKFNGIIITERFDEEQIVKIMSSNQLQGTTKDYKLSDFFLPTILKELEEFMDSIGVRMYENGKYRWHGNLRRDIYRKHTSDGSPTTSVSGEDTKRKDCFDVEKSMATIRKNDTVKVKTEYGEDLYRFVSVVDGICKLQRLYEKFTDYTCVKQEHICLETELKFSVGDKVVYINHPDSIYIIKKATRTAEYQYVLTEENGRDLLGEYSETSLRLYVDDDEIPASTKYPDEDKAPTSKDPKHDKSLMRKEDDEVGPTKVATVEISKDFYNRLNYLGLIPNDVNTSNVGKSDYAQKLIQPWVIFNDHSHLNYLECDIIKRILRTKMGESRMLDLEKCMHILKELIRQETFKEKNNG